MAEQETRVKIMYANSLGAPSAVTLPRTKAVQCVCIMGVRLSTTAVSCRMQPTKVTTSNWGAVPSPPPVVLRTR